MNWLKPTCKQCGMQLSYPVYRGVYCSQSCVKDAKREWAKLVRAYYQKIGVDKGFITPTYEYTAVGKKYKQSKYMDKMTSNWKDIADRTGFNYDGTPKM